MLQKHCMSDTVHEAVMSKPGTELHRLGSEFPLDCLFLNVSRSSWFSLFVISCRQELYCSLGCWEWYEGSVVCLVAAAIFSCPEAQNRRGMHVVPGVIVLPLNVMKIPCHSHGKKWEVCVCISDQLHIVGSLGILLWRYLCDFHLWMGDWYVAISKICLVQGPKHPCHWAFKLQSALFTGLKGAGGYEQNIYWKGL